MIANEKRNGASADGSASNTLAAEPGPFGAFGEMSGLSMLRPLSTGRAAEGRDKYWNLERRAHCILKTKMRIFAVDVAITQYYDKYLRGRS
jgi:hypothetical protein